MVALPGPASALPKSLSDAEVRTELTHEIANLADQLATGRLDAEIGLEVGWHDAARAADALLERQVAGKAVLRVEQ